MNKSLCLPKGRRNHGRLWRPGRCWSIQWWFPRAQNGHPRLCNPGQVPHQGWGLANTKSNVQLVVHEGELSILALIHTSVFIIKLYPEATGWLATTQKSTFYTGPLGPYGPCTGDDTEKEAQQKVCLHFGSLLLVYLLLAKARLRLSSMGGWEDYCLRFDSVCPLIASVCTKQPFCVRVRVT